MPRAPRRTDTPSPKRTVTVHPDGLALEGKDSIVPLLCGAMHYWRHPPSAWGPSLDAMKAMGTRVVDTYVPWGVHELAPNHFDFGERDPRLGVARFLRMAEERGLYVILRPGPHINAELSYFGLPERIVWEPSCQARSPKGNPVILPLVPAAFPVPSYASDAFHDEVTQWMEAVGRELSALVYPLGPIVMLQIDNEGALYFRDGPYDQDYHPDAIRMFRQFLRDRYPTLREFREAWREGEEVTFATASPPLRFDATSPDDLVRHMDWMEFHEHLLGDAMGRMAEVGKGVGFGAIPTSHNLPPGEAATALNPGRLAKVLDLVGLDYYHPAEPLHHMLVMRRTTELVTRAEGLGCPPFAAEMGAGYPPFFAPLDEKDSLYTLLAAIAYGLRGYNLYMAVDRERWIGAPIDPHGVPRKLADTYNALNEALEDMAFHTLRRRAPVRLVVPRVLRRLARATHAFGPVTPAFFNVIGAGFREACLEDELGAGEVPTMVAEAFHHAFERALLVRGVPFAYAGGDSLEVATRGASWIVCATAAGLKPDFFEKLREASAAGVGVTIGPGVPTRDGSMRPMSEPHDVRGLELCSLEDVSQADALVADRIRALSLPTYPVDPVSCFVTVHEDALGAARLVFVMNPTAVDLEVTFPVARVHALRDLLGARGGRLSVSSRVRVRAGAFELEVPARTVRMFAAE